MMSDVSTRRVERVRQEPRRRNLTVLTIEPVGASMLRVTLGGDDLADFSSPGFDDHVKLLFTGPDGAPRKTDLTPRSFASEPRTLVLEIAIHEGGATCEWARTVVPGDSVVVGGPKASVVIPVDYDWHLFAGDITALPAIARRLEELPAGAVAHVIMLAPDAADRRIWPGEVTAEWTATSEAFCDALRAWQMPAGEGFVWAAGEAVLMADIRGEFIERRGHPRGATRISGYWKRDEVGFHETLERGVA